jgi:RHS repeat-associated protein
MSVFSWQTHATTSDWITADPVLEMRTALDQALGAPPSGYAVGLAQNQPIKAVHIQELRDRLLAAWGIDIRWLVTDQLGTPRMVFDKSGSLSGVSRHDYLPFGEELYAGTGGRSAAQGYSVGDGARQKFTSYEHDGETGLEFAQARYYSNLQGRFTGVDPLSGNKPDQPQNWNPYSYCVNNPLVYTDPSGLVWGQRYSKEDNTIYISWYDSWGDMEKAGASAVTDFLVKDSQKGWIVLNAFAKIAEPISDAEYLEGLVNGTNFLRSAGVPMADMVRHELMKKIDPIGLAFVTGGMAAPEEAEAGIMTSGVAISEKGLQIVEEHLIKLEGTLSMENVLMLARLRSALWSGDRLTGADASFYMHETSEATITNRIMAEKGLSYQAAADSAHALTLSKYQKFGMSQLTNYHPDVIRSTLYVNGAQNWGDAYLNRWNIKK